MRFDSDAATPALRSPLPTATEEPEAPSDPLLPPDLHYVDDSQPGIRRRSLRGRFIYVDARGERIRDADEIRRIERLAIPPAYRDVWICSDPQGHLQATGRDARGRKQYRYHPRWREIRDANKYGRMLQFGHSLPALRAQIEKHLALRSLCREKIMATVVALLDATLIRIGNPQYARDNRSYGLTTLRNRHVEVKGASIHFRFRGKSGVEHRLRLDHPRLARVMRRCRELPGQHLFQYLDDQGERRAVTSTDVNAYLREISGADFTAKDYRTWAGSALALARLREQPWEPESEARKNLVETVKVVAKTLGNTPAVCRKCYIHPNLLDAFGRGELARLPKARKRKWLSTEEVALLRFLERHVEAQSN
ncbi:DNA topoisomerase IB [Pseudomonas indica]|uniref:DNA topoisomerase n=1 Tax=Pseudomonas indica TaxID=137658 RepID=A0A1G9NYG0_9PSED|nr:DNA topoisomerase IB [Pseudomonas indica]SDL91420.1 DNA topoisomerase-1 [Pseudomonas indica]